MNRKRVQRLMQRMGLAAIYQRPRTSRPAPEHRIYPYLLRGLRIERVGQVWAADITYIPMARGFLYLVAVMDWVSRYVLAWRLSNLLDASFCIEALEEALSQGRPEIFNTDQGSQFTDDDFTGVLRAHGVAISMDGRGRFADNIFVERLWRSLKYEEVYLKAYESVAEARQGIAAYFEFYNHQRLHQALGYRTPRQVFEQALDLSQFCGGGKTLARSQHYQHNEMQTRAGFLSLRSPDRGLEDRVHLRLRTMPLLADQVSELWLTHYR